MNIYTKKGDEGLTDILGGRVSKNSLRIDVIGSLDELNSFIGLAASVLSDDCSDIVDILQDIQHDLFDAGADVANNLNREFKITSEETSRLEKYIDSFDKELEPIKFFILPGGTEGAAHLHVARSVCRRVEREVVDYTIAEASRYGEIRRYCNRLSDLLFTLARVVNARSGVSDTKYRNSRF